MYLHANAKLGLAGRLALVAAVESALSLRAAATAFNVSPATAHRWWHRWLDGGRRPETLVDRRTDRRGCSLPGCRSYRLCALDRLEGAQASWDLAALAAGKGAGQSLRVALPRRSAAHGHQSLRAFPPPWPQADRRSLTSRRRLDAARNEGRLRLRARDPRRPLAVRLRRAP